MGEEVSTSLGGPACYSRCVRASGADGSIDVATLVARAKGVIAALSVPPRLVVLFGSRARGTAVAQSDVDLAILPNGAMALGDELALEAELTRALGVEVDLVRIDVDDVMLRWRVARDGIVVWASPAHEAPRFLARAASEHDEMAPLLEDAAWRFQRRLAAGGAR